MDFHLIQNYLTKSNWYITDFKAFEWNPADYNFVGPIGRILNARHSNLELRLKKIHAILNHSDAYYLVAKENLKIPTIEHLDLGIERNKGGLNFITGKLTDSAKIAKLDDEFRKSLGKRINQTKSAILGYINYLEELKTSLNKNEAKSSRIGKDLFAKKYELDIVTDYSAYEIYKKALEEKAKTHQKMFTIADELWPKYFQKRKKPTNKLKMTKELIDKISLKHVKREDLFEEINRQIPILADFVREKNLLSQDLDKPLVVRETPVYMRGVAGASVSAPGPYDKNANTYYNVTPLDNYSEEQAESYLREMNDYILQILNMHEAIPGHYTQLIYANKAPSIIKSILGSGAMVEGWANYSVLMMLEEGYNNSPEMWLMRNKWYLRTVCNTIIDYSYHVLDASKEDVVNLLRNEAFQEKTEAENKWRRVTLSSVQLSSYFTGITEVYELREEIKTIEKEKFNLKKFHEEFLSYGKSPVKYIRNIMLKKYKNSEYDYAK
jgi:uncharacterized protein (DUF885 family)